MDIQIIPESDKWILMSIFKTFEEQNKPIQDIIHISDTLDISTSESFANTIINYTWSYSVWVDGIFGGLIVLTHEEYIGYEIQFHQLNHSAFKVYRVAKVCLNYLKQLNLEYLFVRIPSNRPHIVKLCRGIGFSVDESIIEDPGFTIMSANV